MGFRAMMNGVGMMLRALAPGLDFEALAAHVQQEIATVRQLCAAAERRLTNVENVTLENSRMLRTILTTLNKDHPADDALLQIASDVALIRDGVGSHTPD